MDLDTLSKVIKENEIAFNDLVRRYASNINLNDVLKEVEGRTPAERDSFGWFRFRKGQYEIMVSADKITLFGYGGRVDREFRGKEINDCYYKLVEAYKQKQDKPVSF